MVSNYQVHNTIKLKKSLFPHKWTNHFQICYKLSLYIIQEACKRKEPWLFWFCCHTHRSKTYGSPCTWLIKPACLFNFGFFSYLHVISNCTLIKEVSNSLDCTDLIQCGAHRDAKWCRLCYKQEKVWQIGNSCDITKLQKIKAKMTNIFLC